PVASAYTRLKLRAADVDKETDHGSARSAPACAARRNDETSTADIFYPVSSQAPTQEPTSPLAGDGRIARRGLWLAFASAALEAACWPDARRGISRLATAYVGTIVVGISLFSIEDYRLLGAGSPFAQLTALRVVLGVLSAGLLLRIRQRPSRRELEWLILAWS